MELPIQIKFERHNAAARAALPTLYESLMRQFPGLVADSLPEENHDIVFITRNTLGTISIRTMHHEDKKKDKYDVQVVFTQQDKIRHDEEKRKQASQPTETPVSAETGSNSPAGEGESSLTQTEGRTAAIPDPPEEGEQ